MADHTRIRPGDVIDGRYRVEAELGEGGMGRVYRAEHIVIRRPVALKLLHAELRNNDATKERLLREAFATARLQHENCVAISDSGTLDDGTAYLAMELLEGRALSADLDERGPLGVEIALRIARHVLCGLEHAHDQGVVHRDLKPDNIFLVERDGDRHFAKILDFGIAKLMGEALVDSDGKKLTRAGIAVGSPTYMSPEQALGDPIDGRTDLYSLSVVLYEMLTGKPPFQDADKLRVLRMHLTREPPPMSEVAPDVVVPAAVEDLVRSGLAKVCSERIESASDYIERLDDAATRGSAPAITQSATSGTAPALPAPAAATASVNTANNIAPPTTARRLPRRRLLAAGVGTTLLLTVLALTRGSPSGDVAPLPGEAQAELEQLEGEVEAGRGQQHLRALERLAARHQEHRRPHYLLGRVYMEKRYWRDGYTAFRRALRLQPSLRADSVLIRAALSGLSSSSKPELAIRFLVDEVGDPAIPFLEQTVDGGSRRERTNAERALVEIRGSPE